MSVISAEQVERAKACLQIGERDIVTPLALDRARELGVRIERRARVESLATRPSLPQAPKKPHSPGPSAPMGRTPEQVRLPQTEPISGALYRRGAPSPRPAFLHGPVLRPTCARRRRSSARAMSAP